tara:strand:- start:834 stop:983 length:150 start_codon:yes stop_codon:yes gene_type:complete
MGPVNARSIAIEGYLQFLKIIHAQLCKKTHLIFPKRTESISEDKLFGRE